jgi:signal transduction histidine kinase/ActR/RegA family two-component response regulator
MNRQRLFRPFAWGVIVAGAAAVAYSTLYFPTARIDLRFLLLAVITICITSRISIHLPRFGSCISVSDTLIFLTLLLYGGEAAVLMTAAEGLFSSSRFCKKKFTVAFNGAALALSMFTTVWTLRLFFGSASTLSQGFDGSVFVAVCVMALTQYAANSGIIALASSFQHDQPFWTTWKRHYLWTSITYIAGASAAAALAALVQLVGTSALLIATPIILIVYFTYQTYLKNVETSAQQAEQARRHVEELSHYISEQERIREQYAQIEKLSALGELASGVAHDFNNTLAGILGRAQLLMRTDDVEKIRRGLEIIIRSAEDGARTVKRIQDFARQRRDHDLEPVAVDQLLLDVSEITRPRWKDRAEAAGVHIMLDLRLRSQGVVLGDGSELREVLVNMVFNAVDAMPRGGRLTLSADESDGFVEIAVGDTGMGMTQDVRSRIFDPFFTTKGKAGMGLGLAVSYGIIRRHEGNIEVDTEVGRGSSFRIRLPAAAPRPSVAARAEETCAEPRTSHAAEGGLKILVVDDEPAVRELLCDMLASRGHAARAAASGPEALRLFREGDFDAVFTDIGMPGMSGWELAHAVRELDAQLPLAVITGWGEAVGSAEQKAARVDWVVTKPFTAARIAELAAEIAAKRRREPAGLAA